MEKITRTIITTYARVKYLDIFGDEVQESFLEFHRDFKSNKGLITKYCEKKLKKLGCAFIELVDFWTMQYKYTMSTDDFIKYSVKDDGGGEE